MRLHDIISSSLIPRFADDAEWEQNALDVFVKAVRALSFGLGAPYTRKAISALTDADLQDYFLAYGIISYYPELSRQTRENMLFELARMYRFLGTPYAITALCRYIFDESDAVEVEIKDNLAFDDDGELIDASLLDLFDIAIDAQSASIGGSAGDRIVANVLKIARNSQALRNIYFRYEDEVQIPVRCADYIGFAYRIGDDYELSRPVTPAPSYEEITLYLDSTAKLMQAGITSSSTGNVESNTCYTLYTNEELTTPWTGFDYSHEYELGYYTDGGEWIRTPIQSVGEMPDATVPTTSNAKNGRTILDTNKLWLYTNYAYTGVYKINVSRITVRIYPKDQQYYAFYAGNSTYNNIGIPNGNIGGLKGVPSTSANTVPWGVSDASLPTRTIYKILGSVGNEINQIGVGWRDPSLGFNYYQIANNSGAIINLRTVVFSLSVPTFYAYAPGNVDIEMPFTQSVYLVDKEGNRIPTQAGETYILIGLFKVNGDASTNTWSHIYGASKRITLSSYNGYLYLSYSSLVGSVYFHKVWYFKQ